MSKYDSDPSVDAELCDVDLPDGLRKRLRQLATWSDGRLDYCLRDVPDRDGLRGRLRQIVADEVLDERLRHVPVPFGLTGRLRRIAGGRLGRRVPQLAAAALLLLTVGLSYLVAMAGLIWSAYGVRLADRGQESRGRSIVLRSVTDTEAPLLGEFRITAVRPQAAPPPEAELVTLGPWDGQPVTPLDELRGLLADGGDLLHDIYTLRWQVLGAPYGADDDLPALETPPKLVARGIRAPLVRGFDRKFLLNHEVHPVVMPAAHPRLQASVVPLSTTTGSFDLTERLALRGRVPKPRQIRVEDFLAAVDYDFPPSRPGELELRTAAGPSVFGASGAGLLQIGVQAGPRAGRSLPTTYLTVALDVSASMQWDDRLAMTRQALRRLVDDLGDRDRLSLVIFAEEAFVLFENVSRGQIAEVQQTLDHALWAEGATNVAAGLQLASSVALRVPFDREVRRQLVVITDEVAGLPAETAGQIKELLAAVSTHGLGLQIIRLGQDKEVEPLLRELAASGHGHVSPVTTTQQLHQRLRTSLVGSDDTVASDAVLRVQFNPKAVAAYRLLGHEASAAGMMPGTVECQLRAGQAATALYEVWLHPDGEDEIAVAHLTWHDAVSGQSRHRRQRISRLQFATSVQGMPLSLQAAAVAAETAEVLRESYFVPPRQRDLRLVLEVADGLNPRLTGRSSFRRFAALVGTIQRLRQQRDVGDFVP